MPRLRWSRLLLVAVLLRVRVLTSSFHVLSPWTKNIWGQNHICSSSSMTASWQRTFLRTIPNQKLGCIMRHQYQKIVYDCFKIIKLLSYVQEPAFFNEISYVCMFHVSDTPPLHINISRSLFKSCLSTPIVGCPENLWITGTSAVDGCDFTAWWDCTI